MLCVELSRFLWYDERNNFNGSVINIPQTIIFYFDDSGIFDKSEKSGYFIYAGYVFLGRDNADTARRKYIHALREIQNATGFEGELKASILETRHKRSLYNVMRDFESLSVSVQISQVRAHILNDKKSRCRYKDYILKRAVKRKLQTIIQKGLLSRHDDVDLTIYIDEQLTASNGYYDLRGSIYEELKYGIYNFDYGTLHPNIFDAGLNVNIHFCDSRHNYLIQASDILANRIWTSFRVGNPELRNIPKHESLTFP